MKEIKELFIPGLDKGKYIFKYFYNNIIIIINKCKTKKLLFY